MIRVYYIARVPRAVEIGPLVFASDVARVECDFVHMEKDVTPDELDAFCESVIKAHGIVKYVQRDGSAVYC